MNQTPLSYYTGPSGPIRFLPIREIQVPADKLYWEIAHCSFPIMAGIWLNNIKLHVRSDIAKAMVSAGNSILVPLLEYFQVTLPEYISFDSVHLRLQVERDIKQALAKELREVDDYYVYLKEAVKKVPQYKPQEDEIPYDTLPEGTKIETVVHRDEVTVGGCTAPIDRPLSQLEPFTTTITPPDDTPVSVPPPVNKPAAAPSVGGPSLGPAPVMRPAVMPTSLGPSIMGMAAPLLPKAAMSAQVDAAKNAVEQMAKAESSEPQYSGEVKPAEPEVAPTETPAQPEPTPEPEVKPTSLLGLKPLVTSGVGLPEQVVPKTESKPYVPDQVPATPVADTVTTETADSFEEVSLPTSEETETEEQPTPTEPTAIPDISGSALPTVGDDNAEESATV